MKKILLATIALTALSSVSLMAMDYVRCTSDLPGKAAAELAKGRTDGDVKTFGNCLSNAIAAKQSGKGESNYAKFSAATNAKTPEMAKLRQHFNIH
jgi:hypothetical protein